MKKDYAISTVRAVAMVMIICCHILQFYGNELAWWFNSGVQLFLIISGFLYGQKDIGNCISFIEKRGRRILLPYYIYVAPMCIIYFLVDKTKISIYKIFRVLFCVDTIEGMGHLWFVGVILLCYLFTPYLYWFCKSCNYEKPYASCIRMGEAFAFIQVFGIVCFSYVATYRVACYIFGFFWGYCYKHYGDIAIKRTAVILIPITLITNILRIIVKYFGIIQLKGAASSFFSIAEGYCHLLLGATVFLFFKVIVRKDVNKRSIVLDLSDKYSYAIYIVHHFFILGPVSVLRRFSFPFNFCVLIIAIIGSTFLLQSITEIMINMYNNRKVRVKNEN